MKKSALSLLLALYTVYPIAAQQVREQDITYSRYIVREINLRNECNKVIFGSHAELPSILLDALQQGAKAYSYTTPIQPVSYEQVQEKLLIGTAEDSCSFSFYTPQDLYMIELTEQFIFDKQLSEFRFIPVALTLFIPAEISSKGIMEPLAVFPFEECTRIFRKDARAVSAVTKIGQPAVNFNEQFLLRSYTSTIVKIGNKDDLYFDQQYSNQYEAFMAMKKEEQALQEMMYAAYHPAGMERKAGKRKKTVRLR
ncbi:MAG: hypothetical protein ACTHJT_08245 [Cytophaga sp.]|uniref:hypothetical protein n=1 Tax=Cytophaga sp. TaxID=29535 RepID=UPI003F80A60E